ncbi:methyltransferase domain-containing protein [Streptomyces sp. NPDC059650]|uniref:methyltransferase domain-containing protein n=1 Tax=Streptomyces sp. NPDC059650 TaxID=3346896 RepID=UPI0036A9C946
MRIAGVDRHSRDGVDIVATLPDPLDLADGSVGLVRAVDFLEHVPQKIPLINELYRLLAPGGMLLSLTPSSDGRGAYRDISYVQANLIAVKDGADRCGGPLLV